VVPISAPQRKKVRRGASDHIKDATATGTGSSKSAGFFHNRQGTEQRVNKNQDAVKYTKTHMQLVTSAPVHSPVSTSRLP
jgi:hypothetical protein